MIRWPPGAGFDRPGTIGGPPGREEFDHPYDPYGHRQAHDPIRHAHNPNHPYGMEHLYAKNQRPSLEGWGYVGVFDVKPERGEMIANRIRQELDRPLARRIKDFFRIKTASREATVPDVRSLRDHDVVVAVLGKGGESTAMTLFNATVEHFQKRLAADSKARTYNAFTMSGRGVSVHGVAVVPVAMISPFGDDDVLIGNVAVHEFGHAISALGEKRDHETGGVMKSEMVTNDAPLHYTQKFLEQF